MDWLELVASGGLGAVFGGAASIATARHIARTGERGRREEEARQRLLATVRLFRARVAMEAGDAGFKSAMDDDYLTAEKRLRFAQDIEGDLAHVPDKLGAAVRRHVEKLCGTVDARSAELAGPLSLDGRETAWRTAYFLHVAESLTDEQVGDAGLLGAARDAQRVAQGVPAVLDELDRMKETLNRWGRRRNRLARRLGLPWGRS